ncbi:RAD3-like DEAD/DEAH box helicase [Tumebacillus sp. BK434]|nr:RAD3-like DEAD/DEAH box helicase [Tumebacillus sp. BK434]
MLQNAVWSQSVSVLDHRAVESLFLRRLILARKSHRRPAPLDLTALVRSALRFESEKQGHPQMLKVPKQLGWPNLEQWKAAGMELVNELEDGYVIKANPWRPDWLRGSQLNPPDTPLFQTTSKRKEQSVGGDPFLRRMNLHRYRSTAQRDAMRSVLTMPPGSSLLVNLPTSEGKSLLAHMPALLDQESEELTVVVVPTVALTIDQGSRIEEFIGHPAAYFQGSGREAVNRAIRERIELGTQRILFTSPESLLNSLQSSLHQAAESGSIKRIVIDEAHIVDAWGDEFRSSFQELAGWRRGLMRVCPAITTVLLSATVTESCLYTLETLFASPEPLHQLASVRLRSEPSFWNSCCADDVIKQERLIEAINHLPRPLILYTTKVEDAEYWARTLREMGYSRLSSFTGNTKSEQREHLLEQWREDELDVIVATSAFGLGVDKTDIRAVVHACVPESLDRFYQEVGRGGRDGRASLSLMLYTSQDLQIAKRMNSKKLIGVKRGLERWTQMFRSKQEIPGAPRTYHVSTDVNPGNKGKDLDMNNMRNQAWNVRTLTLMARARLIEFDWEATPRKNSSLIRILDADHRIARYWEAHVGKYREESIRSDKRNYHLMLEVLRDRRCVSASLQDLYTISDRGVRVTPVCGGCAHCRKTGAEVSGLAPSSQLVRWDTPEQTQDSYLMTNLVGENGRLVIFYDREHRNFWKLMRWFADQGIRHFVGDADFVTELSSQTFASKKPVFSSELSRTPRRSDWPEVPTVLVHPSDPQAFHPQIQFALQGDLQCSICVFLLPKHLPDPQHPNRTYRDITMLRSYELEAFLTEVRL